jgi:hypothetical protein
MSKTISARIRFLTVEEGGRLDPARDGIQPQLKLGDVHTSCVVSSCDEVSVFDAGVMYDVRIEVMFWAQYSHLFSREDPVQLFDGSRLIAEGEVVGDR